MYPSLPPTSTYRIFRRIYLLKMPCVKRRKWHFREPKFKNVLGEHAPSPPILECLRRSNFLLACAYTFKVSHNVPGSSLAYFEKETYFILHWTAILGGESILRGTLPYLAETAVFSLRPSWCNSLENSWATAWLKNERFIETKGVMFLEPV